jgi:hypothetical protein
MSVLLGMISFYRREISFNHGGEWKALISTYIGTIPVSSDASRVAEHSISCMRFPWIPVSNAMITNVGAAARRRKLDATKTAVPQLLAKAGFVLTRRGVV